MSGGSLDTKPPVATGEVATIEVVGAVAPPASPVNNASSSLPPLPDFKAPQMPLSPDDNAHVHSAPVFPRDVLPKFNPLPQIKKDNEQSSEPATTEPEPQKIEEQKTDPVVAAATEISEAPVSPSTDVAFAALTAALAPETTDSQTSSDASANTPQSPSDASAIPPQSPSDSSAHPPQATTLHWVSSSPDMRSSLQHHEGLLSDGYLRRVGDGKSSGRMSSYWKSSSNIMSGLFRLNSSGSTAGMHASEEKKLDDALSALDNMLDGFAKEKEPKKKEDDPLVVMEGLIASQRKNAQQEAQKTDEKTTPRDQPQPEPQPQPQPEPQAQAQPQPQPQATTKPRESAKLFTAMASGTLDAKDIFEEAARPWTPTPIPADAIPEERQRISVANEIVSTEIDFVKDVSFVAIAYSQPLKENPHGLSPEEYLALFNNLDPIMVISLELLQKLQAGGDSGIGATFLALSEFLKCYLPFCACQQPRIDLLKSIVKRNSDFRKFIAEVKAMPESRHLDLDSFLMRPVQRICKYPLLLRELRKVTRDEKQCNDLDLALKKIQGVVDMINTSTRGMENQKLIYDLSLRLTNYNDFLAQHGELTTPARRLVKEGSVSVVVAHSLEKAGKASYELILFNDLMLLVTVLGRKKLRIVEWFDLNDILLDTEFVPEGVQKAWDGSSFHDNPHLFTILRPADGTLFVFNDSSNVKWIEHLSPVVVARNSFESEECFITGGGNIAKRETSLEVGDCFVTYASNDRTCFDVTVRTKRAILRHHVLRSNGGFVCKELKYLLDSKDQPIVYSTLDKMVSSLKAGVLAEKVELLANPEPLVVPEVARLKASHSQNRSSCVMDAMAIIRECRAAADAKFEKENPVALPYPSGPAPIPVPPPDDIPVPPPPDTIPPPAYDSIPPPVSIPPPISIPAPAPISPTAFPPPGPAPIPPSSSAPVPLSTTPKVPPPGPAPVPFSTTPREPPSSPAPIPAGLSAPPSMPAPAPSGLACAPPSIPAPAPPSQGSPAIGSSACLPPQSASVPLSSLDPISPRRSFDSNSPCLSPTVAARHDGLMPILAPLPHLEPRKNEPVHPLVAKEPTIVESEEEKTVMNEPAPAKEETPIVPVAPEQPAPVPSAEQPVPCSTAEESVPALSPEQPVPAPVAAEQPEPTTASSVPVPEQPQPVPLQTTTDEYGVPIAVPTQLPQAAVAPPLTLPPGALGSFGQMPGANPTNLP